MKKISALLFFIIVGLMLNARNSEPFEATTSKDERQQHFAFRKRSENPVSTLSGNTRNSTLSNYKPANITHSPNRNILMIYQVSPAKISKTRCTTEAGYTLGSEMYKIDLLKLNVVYAYLLTPGLSAGFGSGIRYALPVKDALIPVFADFRADFSNKNIPVYMALDVGYALDITSNFQTEGWYFLMNPSAGVCIHLPSGPILHVGIGYDVQRYKMSESGYNAEPGTTIHTTGFSINAGLSF